MLFTNISWTDSPMQVGKLLKHRADILLPIKVRDQWDCGTVVDFAHEVFKQVSIHAVLQYDGSMNDFLLSQDKRLACLPYNALSKSERTRYKAARKLIQHLVNLLRCKALENITKGLHGSYLLCKNL